MLMVLSCTARYLLSLALLILAATAYDGQPEGHSGGGSATPSNINECEAHTINYITHTLPQLCPTSTWRSATDGKGDAHDDGEATPTVSSPRFNSTTTTTTDSNSGGPTDPVVSSTNNNGAEPTEAAAEKSGDSSFMSFEDWKEMMLRQTGQDPQDLRSRKATSSQGRVRDPPDMGHYGLGEEDEISLDFEKYLNQEKADTPSSVAPSTDEASGVQPGDAIQDGERPFLHLSKDAGKTCKERFSYSSFDAGATILKTGRSTKNAKAILVENKDSYMLLECSVDSKYVIVELSDDVLIDTVVLANFEFFSSMIRHFRVSVSDRYPVKLERWRDIGTFEARNSRDVQAFLIENPQIWAKYVRIEFLTHYGNEFYCPVSLLRIHGSRMLDSWKDTETIRDEELQIEAEESARAARLEIETRKEANIEATKDSSDLEKPETRLNFTLWEISPTVIFGQFCLYDYTSTNEAQDAFVNNNSNDVYQHPCQSPT
ncbi:Sad1 / UNC-like C-terminal [Geosmithia morbida]|uniref:Sad1 / UNC-like C-terminal n=1 Tax=Geosmithia morbida TaxID=1094350 RepID=A0A9P4YR42_9HYPO|nr:Sad1 / UNC-like C-terminal [Geosmithia morbida]KAF4120249.1 Sad1 / UNC-like C-terminal [Geosmithia morbida]